LNLGAVPSSRSEFIRLLKDLKDNQQWANINIACILRPLADYFPKDRVL
jgi:hypothetical protein